jgi:hypothetical protein
MASRSEDRALILAERFPAAAEALRFYARMANFQGSWEDLLTLVRQHASPLLRDAADGIDRDAAIANYISGEDRRSAASFFARVWLRAHPPEHLPSLPPQCGILRTQGDGVALTLLHPLTLEEQPWPRAACPACQQESLEFHGSSTYEHVKVQVCTACRGYLHLIDLSIDPLAVPEADEIAALPLDCWAMEQGYAKLHPNLVGI